MNIFYLHQLGAKDNDRSFHGLSNELYGHHKYFQIVSKPNKLVMSYNSKNFE